jgi:hypothetical protein
VHVLALAAKAAAWAACAAQKGARARARHCSG